MRNFRKLSLALVLALGAAAPLVACGDDDNLVRERPDAAAGDGSLDGPGSETGPGTLACGAVVPATYESPNFALNAKEELDLKTHFAELEDTMKTAEGTGTAVVTAAQLQAIFTAGTPNLRSIATAAAQAKVDDYITQFGDIAVAGGKTWTPADAEAEGGAPNGGKYEAANIFSATGVDLREGVAKILLGGALYNHALALSTGPITEATVDRLLAVFGATTKLANRTDADAGADEKDELVAEYAARRDSKTGTTLGPYRKIKGALLVAKAAAAGGEKCRADLDAALKVYFLEWEKASYLTVIFYLNAAATNASANPVKGPAALHGFGEAAGFLQSFKGIPQDRRKITDAQIDKLLDEVGAATPYKLITNTAERLVAFNGAFQEIGAIYGLTQTDIEEAKKTY
jgi:hypothetical protein